MMAELLPGNEISLPASPRIGTLQEMSLHAALKTWYAQPGDQLETAVDGFVIDILRGDLLIEIQTRHFSALKSKLARLVETHQVRLVYPIAQEKWIIRTSGDLQTPLSRRKSPKRGRIEAIFTELIRIPGLINHPNFSLEILLIQAEEIWQDDGRGSWRRKGWSISDRRLVSVLDRRAFYSAQDFRALLPAALPPQFTTRELAAALRQPVNLSGKMLYCLSVMGAVARVGKRGNSNLYSTQLE